jgi:hypothetical protein
MGRAARLPDSLPQRPAALIHDGACVGAEDPALSNRDGGHFVIFDARYGEFEYLALHIESYATLGP